LAVRSVYNFKDKLTKQTQGQGLHHKAKTKAKDFIIKAKDFKQVLKDRPRPRPRTKITDKHKVVLFKINGG